jgi:hypothetical protein
MDYERSCGGVTAAGGRCVKPSNLVGDDGYCDSHRPGGEEHMRAIGSVGGEATKAKFSAQGFAPGEIPEMVDLASAQRVLNMITQGSGVMPPVVTHQQAAVMTRAAEAWIKAEGAAITGRLVTDLQKELNAKEEEIKELRKQITALGRDHLRVAK